MNITTKLVAAAGLALTVAQASAQNTSWIAGVGNWSNPAKWTAGVPNSTTASAIIADPGGYIITLDMNASVATLQKLIPGPQLNFTAGRTIDVYGGLMYNNGATVVNTSASNSATAIRFRTIDAVISADPGQSGQLTLNAYSGNLDAAYLQSFDNITVTNDVDHTIDGTGNIYARLVNEGLVEADHAGRVLQLLGDPKTNHGLMAARPGATLSLNGISMTQGAPVGVLLADEGTIAISGSAIAGGELNSVGAGVVNVTGNSTITDLSGDASPFIATGQTLTTNGTIVLTGTTTVNTTASNSNTSITTASDTIWDDGVINLNSYSGNLDAAYIQTAASTLFTNNATIQGRGRIHGNLRNNGLVETGSGKVMELLGSNKVSRGIIRAAGGTMWISNITLTNNADAVDGQIISDAGTVNLNACTISDGVMNAINGGRFVVPSTSSLIGGVSGSGPIDVNTGQVLIVNQPAWSHAGILLINRTASNNETYLRVDQNCAIADLTVQLNAYSGNLDAGYVQTLGSAVATFAPSTLITGHGRLYGAAVLNGPVTVTGAGNVIDLLSLNKTNNGTAKAESSGSLYVTGITLSQGASGQLLADAGTVRLVGATISGGQIHATNGGRTVVTSSSTLAGGVSGSGPMDLNTGQVLFVNEPAWNHSGTLLINTTASNNQTYVRFDQNCTVSNATLSLNAYSGSLDAAYIQTLGSAVVTIDNSTLVTGHGRIYGTMTNNGVVRPAAGKTISLLSLNKSNNGTMEAVGSGTLWIDGITLTQGASGVVRADGTTVAITGSTISGGHLIATNGGSVEMQTSSTLAGGVSGNGPVNLTQGQACFVSQATWNHTGVLTINKTASNAGTYLRVEQSCTLGDVTILLNRYSGNIDSAYLNTLGAAVGAFGPSATLAGSGNVYGNWQMGGTLSPGGGSVGTRATIGVPGTMTFLSSGVFDTEVGGASSFDTITGGGSVTVNGTLRARLVNGFNPTPGQTFDVVSVTTRTGTFAATDFDRFPEGPERFYVTYPAGKVRLNARRCPADWNGDGFVNGDDYDLFGEQFEAGDSSADFNNDGFVNGDDYDSFASFFENGC